jgi:hypothetical protein
VRVALHLSSYPGLKVPGHLNCYRDLFTETGPLFTPQDHIAISFSTTTTNYTWRDMWRMVSMARLAVARVSLSVDG